MSEQPVTVNENGEPALIEAVYYRYGRACRNDFFDTVEEAAAYLCSGEDYGALSSVGVFVDGEPVLADVYVEPHPPDEYEARVMAESYRKAL